MRSLSLSPKPRMPPVQTVKPAFRTLSKVFKTIFIFTSADNFRIKLRGSCQCCDYKHIGQPVSTFCACLSVSIPRVQQTSKFNLLISLTISKILSKAVPSLTSLQAAPIQKRVAPSFFACLAFSITVCKLRSFSFLVWV